MDGGHGGSGNRPHGGGGGGGGGNNGGGGRRNKRRRQRPQRPNNNFNNSNKRRSLSPRESAALDSVGRERMFQQVEGLLRQIREEAEEHGAFSDDQLRDYVSTVTTFMTLLEEESEPLTERARSEFLRVRDKLSNALRG